MARTGIERLNKVLPANQNAMNKAKTMGDIPNISTEPCAETPAFNSHQLEGAFRDQAGLGAKHLDVAASYVANGQQDLRALRQEISDSGNQLSRILLPDTKVNIEGLKIEVPFELKQYAVDIDQERYMEIMASLLGKERRRDLRACTTKSNQNTTPALWLNQAVFIECKKPYVYNIGKNLDKMRESGKDMAWMEEIDDALDMQVSNYLEMALGYQLRGLLNQIAQANTLPIYVVFVLVVDEILNSRKAIAVPATASSLWDPFDEDEELR